MYQTSVYAIYLFLRKTVCWKSISLVLVICFPGLILSDFFHTQKRHFSVTQMILSLVVNGPGSKLHEAKGCTLVPSTVPSLEYRGAHLVFRGMPSF